MVHKNATLERFGIIAHGAEKKTKSQVSRYGTIQSRLPLPERRQISEDIHISLKKKKFANILLGQGREFQVYDLRGFKFGVVLKKPKRKLTPKGFDEQISKVKEHIRAHREWVKSGIRIPELLTTQMRLSRRPAHVFIRVLPLVRADFIKIGRNIVVKPKRTRYYPAEDICKLVSGIIEQIRIADKKKINIDSMLENFGLSKDGVVYVDTFHIYNKPVGMHLYRKASTRLDESVFRFLASCKRYYSEEDLSSIKKTVLDEVGKQYKPGTAKRLENWLKKYPPEF